MTCPPSQEFKISSSTDRALFRRKAPSMHTNARNDHDQPDGPNGGRQSKSSYKKASERPPAAVARRNARERRRVHTVNQAFNRLKAFVPTLKHKTKRVSKLKILKAAIDYVYDLQDILAESEQISVRPATSTNEDTNDGHTGRHRTREHTDNGRFAEDCPNYGRSAASTEDPRVSYCQNSPYPYQYALPAALMAEMCNSQGIGPGRVTMPALPLASSNDRAVHYPTGHLEFAPCQCCGRVSDTGPCQHCPVSSFSGYTYPGPSSSFIM